MKVKLYLNYKIIFLVLISSFILSSCSKDELPPVLIDNVENYNNEVLKEWANLYLEVERYAPNFRPPISARTMGYIGLAVYESVVDGTVRNKSIAHNFQNLNIPGIDQTQDYYWPLVINSVYAQSMKLYFPHISNEYRNKIKLLEEKFNDQYRSEISDEVFDRSTIYGRGVASAVYNYSATDPAGHEGFYNPTSAAYVPPQGINLWQPTAPDYSRALLPYWGFSRTFALSNSDKLCDPPLEYSEDPNSEYYKQVYEVYDIVENMNYDNRWIAEFWSDDNGGLTFTPAGRLLAIGLQLLDMKDLNLAETAEFFAKLGMALSDSGVAVWHSKYHYNLERPSTVINRIIDPNWVTICNNPITGDIGKSPNFPAYPSGHSGFGSAGGLVFAEFFGMNFSFTDNCHKDRTEFNGTPRSFTSFKQMWEENAYSRIPLGVHYQMDCDSGIELGLRAARAVIDLDWK